MATGRIKTILVVTAACYLGACGGGGGGSIVSTPPPPPAPLTPTPTPTPSGAPVTIFTSPVPGEYTTVGTSVNLGSLDSWSEETRITDVSSASADQPRIRYTAQGHYEVQFPGTGYDRLVHYKGLLDPTVDNNYFQPAGAAQNQAYFIIRKSRAEGFSYSELAGWGLLDGRFGSIAFGTPTTAGNVPRTGTATYQGLVAGVTDVMYFDNLYGGFLLLPAEGTVSLGFDFGRGTLDGELSLSIPDGMNPRPVGTFAFTQTVFSPGSATYSGMFATSLAGKNFFSGLFTGPNAQETIGAWAVPFTLDGQNHQASGAWIAKRP